MLVSPRRSRTTLYDLVTTLMLGAFAILALIIFHVNPPTEKNDADPPGNVVVAISWPTGNVDVDLWITGPGEPAPVGYSNKSGKLFNLLRDDLGGPDEALNYENSYSRGIVAGEYIVNVHAYRGTFPQPVHVEISLNTGKPGKGMTPVATTSLVLTANGQEKTALRFRLDKDGKLVAGSMNAIYRPLRAANSGAM